MYVLMQFLQFSGNPEENHVHIPICVFVWSWLYPRMQFTIWN